MQPQPPDLVPLAQEVRERLLGPSWAWLTGPVKATYEKRGADVTTITIDFGELPSEAAVGYASVLRQRTLPNGVVRANRRKLDAALSGSALARTSEQLLVELLGPLDDQPGARANYKEQHEALWARALGHAALQRHPRLLTWLEAERSAGRLPADPTERAALLQQTLTVLAHLPSGSTVGLARLGWSLLGDTKALTSPTPLRAAVLRALSAVAHVDVPSNAEQRAQLWESFGAVANPLVSQVLVAGARLAGDGPVASMLRMHAEAGLAARLTLEQVAALEAEGAAWPHRVFVVENPEVVTTTLAELGSQHPPLLCTEGRPHRAADRLVGRLVAQGVEVLTHNDFDWDGLAINRALQARGALPWRMTAADLRRAAAAHDGDQLPALTGAAVATPWDSDLAAALDDLGREVHEEDHYVLAALLADLKAEAHSV